MRNIQREVEEKEKKRERSKPTMGCGRRRGNESDQREGRTKGWGDGWLGRAFAMEPAQVAKGDV